VNFEAKLYRDIHIQQWLGMDHTLGAGNWITVSEVYELIRTDSGLNFCKSFIFIRFWYVI